MIIDTLKKSKIFSSLKDNELKKVSLSFGKVNLKKDGYIFNEGGASDWFYLVAKGRIKIVKHTVMGKDVILEVMSPGDIFGSIAVLDKKPYPASAQAMEPATVIRINRQNLLKIMDEYPILKLEIVKYFSERLRDAHEMLKNIAAGRVEKRIASLLLKLSEKIGTVETCIRTMSKFQKQGMVRSSRGRILIKVNALQKFLED